MSNDLAATKKWFRKARLGAFIHWGLYSLPGGVWEGTSVPYLAEWLQAARRIPKEQYAQLAQEFNPQEFDADKLVAAFAAAGMRYIVFTAKHHEGFAMWRSRASAFNSFDATPAKRDFVAEWATACRKHGVKLGLYYSHCLDWHERDGGDPRPCPDNFGMSWGNDWDFPDQSTKRFDHYFEGKVLPQLTELLTNYGEVAVLWLDCPMTVITPRHAEKILDLVHSLQPACLVNSRLCALETMGDYGSLGDNQLPAGTAPSDFPRETIITLNDSWGYKSADQNWKSPQLVRQIAIDAAQADSNLLVNFGPDGNGALPAPAWNVLHNLAQWGPAAQEAIHSGGQLPFPQDLGWARAIAADKHLWLFPREDTPITATLAGVSGELANASGATVSLLKSSGEWRLDGLRARAETQTPVCLEFVDTPIYEPLPRIQNGRLILLPAGAQLLHGQTENQTATAPDAPLGAAGEQLAGCGHSTLASNGALADWGNPTDQCRWTIFLAPGQYRLRLLTRNAAHSQPWCGQRIVEVQLGDDASLTGSLKPDEPLADSAYYHAAYSDLGTITIASDGETTLSLRTLQLTAPEAATMQLEQCLLEKREA